ncbi:hypothetical protein [Nitrosophilus labii]|uniref:hypothetical protein n=1 Tax=Nitrosophilus labii TaxID=2706014 RepID=UPI0016569FD1|nr:hypothetical protein [Nitrosophilus labii]
MQKLIEKYLKRESVFILNSQLAFLALLRVMDIKKISIPANAPFWFATIPKFLGIDIELKDINLDFSSKSDIQNLFFESFEPKQGIIGYQNFGEVLGEFKVSLLEAENFCAVASKDEVLIKELKKFIDSGVKKGKLWNFDIETLGIDIKAKNLVMPDIKKIEEQKEIVDFFEKAFNKSRYLDILKISSKTIKTHYPVLLKPELYCPKEDIISALIKSGFDLRVHFKPIYRLSLVGGDFLPISEEVYKAQISLPYTKEVLEPFLEILEKYSYRGCSF